MQRLKKYHLFYLLDQEECRTPSEKTQTSITGYKQRTVLGDLDVNRPPSPGRRIPRAFLATGLTLHQVVSISAYCI